MNSAVYKDTVTKPLKISYLKKVGALTVRNMVLSAGKISVPFLGAMVFINIGQKKYLGFLGYANVMPRDNIVLMSVGTRDIF